MKIVIIEDEKDLGILMRNFLVKQLNVKTPDTVRIATTLTEGKAYINQLNPEWVFIDNNLPDGKGINEIEHIKKSGDEYNRKVVMMSAMTNLREEALKKGADYFLDKPISFVEVKNLFNSQEG
ncbi:Response regulator receiver domain-containing protein [Dyadobacter koreensis]|uniref:Response regulator receiver domain-containing protein n=1 Tax=Dyadobacter koreensis TaxID=408657 RepID=A0A1H6RGS5_9BACT|nr:response regulator [Dyadobacter koreensis]SEI54943.1 Response regulator receiver domain-containing protein [Dyadobacter koreensis]